MLAIKLRNSTLATGRRTARAIWCCLLVAWALVLSWYLAGTLRTGDIEVKVVLDCNDDGLVRGTARIRGSARSAIDKSLPTAIHWFELGRAEHGGALEVEYSVQLPGAGEKLWSEPRVIAGSSLFPFDASRMGREATKLEINLPEDLSGVWTGAAVQTLSNRTSLILSGPKALASGMLAVGALVEHAPADGAEELLLLPSKPDGRLAHSVAHWRASLGPLLAPSPRPSTIVVLEDASARLPAPTVHAASYALLAVSVSGDAAREAFHEGLALHRLADGKPLLPEHEWLDAALARRIALALGDPESHDDRWRALLAYQVFLSSSHEASLREAIRAEGRSYNYLARYKGPLLLRAVELASGRANDALRCAADWIATRTDIAGGTPPAAAVRMRYGAAGGQIWSSVGGGEDPLGIAPFGEDLVLQPERNGGGTPHAEVTLAVTADTEAFLETCGCRLKQAGGLARRAALIDRAAREAPVLALDLGNVFPRLDNEAFDNVARREIAVQLTADRRHMGYVLHVLGPNELYAGIDELQAIGTGTFAAANANLSEGSAPWSRATLKADVAGLRFAIVPICPATPYWIDPDALRRRTQGIEITDPIEVVRKHAANVSDGDVLVVAGALPTWRIPDLVRAVPDVDLVVSADRRTTAWAPGLKEENPHLLVSGWLGETLVLLTNEEGHGLSLTRVEFDERGRALSFRQEDILLSPDLPEDPEVREMLDDLYREIEREGEAETRRTPLADLDAEAAAVARGADAYAGSDACLPCHREEHERWERTPHAQAFRTLEEAHRARSPDCVRCHVVGYGLPGGFTWSEAGRTPSLRGVGCETCHGPGLEHIQRLGDSAAIRTAFPREACERCHDAEHSEPLSGRSVDPFDVGAHRPGGTGSTRRGLR